MGLRQTCTDCRTLSPETESEFTLISSRFGWRLSRERLPGDQLRIAWRCPSCWQKYKASKPQPATGPMGAQDAPPSGHRLEQDAEGLASMAYEATPLPALRRESESVPPTSTVRENRQNPLIAATHGLPGTKTANGGKPNS
jgi:hypothetical protein